MKWGKAGLYYGILVMITGLVTAIIRGDYHSVMGREAEAFFSRAPGIRDIIIFGILYCIVMVKRRYPFLIRYGFLVPAPTSWYPQYQRQMDFSFKEITSLFIHFF